MASTSVEIFFVGLCSFLNMHNNVAYMPPPSVVMHRVDPGMRHQAFIAWKDTDAVLDNEANFPVRFTKNGIKFLALEGEELSLNDDQSGPPDVDTSYNDHVAHLMKYADLASTPVFDQNRVPLKGHPPDSTVEAAYLEFGKGKIKSDWDTEKQFVFREISSSTPNPSDPDPHYYHRRVSYTYDASADALVIVARKFDNSSKRKLIFKPKSGTSVTVWMGNSMNIDEDMDPRPPITSKVGAHFKFFYDTLAIPASTVYLPVIEGSIAPPTKPPSGGSGTGYCGPDGQP